MGAALVILAAALVIGCKDKEVPEDPPIGVESVTLNYNALQVTVGGTAQIYAVVLPEDAANKTIFWESKKPAVATVEDGLIRGVAVGSATITVTTEDGDITDICEVSVITGTIGVTGVTLTPPAVSITERHTATLTAAIIPPGATNKTVTWKTSTGNVTVADDGLSAVITGVTVGEDVVTVTTADGGKTAETAVTVVEEIFPVQNVNLTDENGQSLDNTTIELVVDDTKQLTVTYIPVSATNKSVIWTAVDPSIASVSDTGLVTGIAPGTTAVTVTSVDGNKTAIVMVKVKAKTIPVTSVSFAENAVTIVSGHTGNLFVIVHPENATNKNVTYTSSEQATAWVVGTGHSVQVNSIGGLEVIKTVTITVTTEDGGFTDECVVTVLEHWQTIPVTGVELTDDEGESLDGSTITIRKGQTRTLDVEIQPSGALNKTITADSADEDIATVSVSSNGREITIRGEEMGGPVAVTIKTGYEDPITHLPFTATVNVNVSAPPLTGVTLDQTAAAILKGGTVSLSPSAVPTDATASYTWSSSAPAVATVTNGVVTGVARGVATITVTAKDDLDPAITKTATCTVTVNPIPISGGGGSNGVTLSFTSVTLEKQETRQLNVTVNPSDADIGTITWSIVPTNNSAGGTPNATVTNGLVNAGTVWGTATVTVTVPYYTSATSNATTPVTATCTVTINPTPVSSVTITPASASITKTASTVSSAALTAAILPTDADINTITWSSSSTNNVTVTAGGTPTSKTTTVTGPSTAAVGTYNNVITAAVVGYANTINANSTVVVKREIDSFTPYNLTLTKGGAPKNLSWLILPGDADQDVTYVLNDPNSVVQSMSKSSPGVITVTPSAIKTGTATVTVTTVGLKGNATVTETRTIYVMAPYPEWTAQAQPGNTWTPISIAKDPAGTASANSVLKLLWGDSRGLNMATDVFARVPDSIHLEEWNGVMFDISVNANTGIMLLIRGGDTNGDAWQIGSGAGTGNTFLVYSPNVYTVYMNFSDSVLRDDWNGTNYPDYSPKTSLSNWLNANTTLDKWLFINPETSGAAGSNVQHTVTLKNIGFFKGTATNQTETKILWATFPDQNPTTWW